MVIKNLFRPYMDFIDRDLCLSVNFEKISNHEEVSTLALTLNRFIVNWQLNKPIEKIEITKAEGLFLR